MNFEWKAFNNSNQTTITFTMWTNQCIALICNTFIHSIFIRSLFQSVRARLGWLDGRSFIIVWFIIVWSQDSLMMITSNNIFIHCILYSVIKKFTPSLIIKSSSTTINSSRACIHLKQRGLVHGMMIITID